MCPVHDLDPLTLDLADEPFAAVAETHTGVVVFVGDRAYQLKKPVTFPFLDHSSIDARRRCCEQEVALNRRLAPDIYLGVAAGRREAGRSPRRRGRRALDLGVMTTGQLGTTMLSRAACFDSLRGHTVGRLAVAGLGTRRRFCRPGSEDVERRDVLMSDELLARDDVDGDEDDRSAEERAMHVQSSRR